ncbi:MAG: Rne/Rng family ribonuclease [Chthonomonadaceae bacterium]|nr:Rne/Rng family ribonuclease [Chthonomonadaceae bacterium]
MSLNQLRKDILVNVGERETRIAVLEDDRLVELHIERSERVVGNLYKCKVANVLKGMDAAFVDIGLERNAFLYVGDVIPTREEEPKRAPAPTPAPVTDSSQQRFARGGRRRNGSRFAPQPSTMPLDSALENTDDEDAPEVGEGFTAELPADMMAGERENAGNSGLQEDALEALAAEAEAELRDEMDEDDSLSSEEEAFADLTEDVEEVAPGSGRVPRRPPMRRSVARNQKITDVAKIGQELLVQVIKGPRGTKGARVSTRVSLPGRYLVLMPEGDSLGVSRKIEDVKERDRLKKIGDRIRVPGYGIIIRTEAEEKTEVELQQDLDFLVKSWREIEAKSKTVRAPAILQQDLTLLYKTIRDVFGSDVNKLVIDSPAEYEKANELIERLSPKLKGRIHLYDGEKPLFDHYKLEEEIERSLRRKVFMKSGGSLVIDETEALTVIDVNSSKFVGSSSLNETIVKVNLDAANEIARQLRLRDIGRIIVIDFIDMNSERDRVSVRKSLENALKRDRSRTKISNISPLGLIEMTRKRTGETLTAFITEECPFCKGRGTLPSAETVSVDLERELRRVINTPNFAKKEAVLINCHPDVAELFVGVEGTAVAQLELEIEKAIYVRAVEDDHIEQFNLKPGDIGDYEKLRLNYRRAQVVECKVMRSLLKETGKCIGWAEGMLIDLDDGAKFMGQKAKVRILDVRRSYASAEVIPGTNRPLSS